MTVAGNNDDAKATIIASQQRVKSSCEAPIRDRAQQRKQMMGELTRIRSRPSKANQTERSLGHSWDTQRGFVVKPTLSLLILSGTADLQSTTRAAIMAAAAAERAVNRLKGLG